MSIILAKSVFNDEVERVISIVLNEANSEKTAVVYEAEIRKFLTFSAGRGAQSPAQAVGVYKRHLQDEGYAASTINKKLSAIRKFFKMAQREGLIPADQASKAQSVESIPQRGQKKGNWLDVEGMRALLNFPAEEDENEDLVVRDRAIIAVFLSCALRSFELAGLTWGQVQSRKYGDRTIWQLEDIQGKHHRVRTVPIADYAVKALADWRFLCPDPANNRRVFVSMGPDGEWNASITTNGIWRIIKHRAAAAGFPEISVHDLRRSAATLLYRRTENIKQAQHMLGHSSVAVTEKYLDTALDVPTVVDAMEL